MTGLLALAWVFWRVEYDRLLEVIDHRPASARPVSRASRSMIKLRPAIRMLRSVISKSWVLSRFYYRWHGIRLLRLIGEEETGAEHCQHDNPTIGQEYMADWLADRFGIDQRELLELRG